MKSIKEIRKSKGITQTKAAELIGMKLRAYQDWENSPGKYVKAALDAKEILMGEDHLKKLLEEAIQLCYRGFANLPDGLRDAYIEKAKELEKEASDGE